MAAIKTPKYTDGKARWSNVNIYHTDLHATFARVRAEQAAEKVAMDSKVKQIRKKA